MTQPLILAPQIEFTKLAAETALPEDPNQWTESVLQEIYKQVPYLADFDLDVVMETVDGERAYGLGHVEVSSKSESPMTAPPEQQASAGIRKARIPVIIKDGKLLPFDVLLTDDSRALPLTEGRLRQAMFRPQNFDVTSKTPGDQSMIGQLYPPYRQNYGFGGGGVTVGAGMGGKTASALEDWLMSEATKGEKTAGVDTVARTHEVTRSIPVSAIMAHAKKTGTCCEEKTGSVLDGVLASANLTDLHDFKESLLDLNTKVAFVHNPAAFESLERLSNANPVSLEKRASALAGLIAPSVVQVVKLAEGYAIKTASHRAWAPKEEHVDRGEVVRRFGPKVALAADLSGATTMAPQPGVSEDGSPAPGAGAGPISAPGMYQVQSVEGETLTGVVIPNLIDVSGSPLPISLFTDGQHAAVQSDIAGTPVGEFVPPGLLPANEARGHGVFYSDVNGVPQATLPLTLGASMQGAGVDEQPRFQAETFDGRPVQVSVQPYVQSIVNTDGVMLIPDGWQWLPLDGAADVSLAETAGEVGKTAALRRKLASVELRALSADSFSVRGHMVEKLAMDQRQDLTQAEAMFLLVGLGADPVYVQKKMASALGSPFTIEEVRVGHVLHTAQEKLGESYTDAARYLDSTPVFRRRMWKEAAAIPDPVAVDAVLSLGFLNPENMSTYIGYLPTLDEAQRRLCELLIASRLGMRELAEGAIERAIRALEDVIEGLKVLAFQG